MAYRAFKWLLVGLLATIVVAPSGVFTQGGTVSGAHPGATATGVARAPAGASAPAGREAPGSAATVPETPSTPTTAPASAWSAPTSCEGIGSSGASHAASSFASAGGAGAPFVAGVDRPTGTNDSAPSAVAPVVAAAIAAGACPQTIFPPRAPATAQEREEVTRSGTVTPLYDGTPAPMGVADYGLTSGVDGALVGSVLDTTSLLGALDVNATGILPLDLYNEEVGPDAYSVQLNAVLTNVTLFGPSGYEFWTQSVIEYYPSAHVLDLITNVWNFSGNYLFGSAIYAHGPNGTLYAGEVYEAVVTYPHISYPFNLSLYLNSTLTSGRDAVYFTDVLTGPSEGFVAPFDYVIFNSTTATSPPLRAPAEFSANGTGYDPIGLTNDFELDVGGPGGGSQATLVAADAELALAYWDPADDGGHGGYLSVPSAFSFGGETGETSSGATVTWSDAPRGPEAISTYGVMATGPSFLQGLWNASGPEGAYPVTIDSSPANAFDIVTPAVATVWTDLTPTLAVSPIARAGAVEAYDPALNATILFGGYSPTAGGLNDTWEFADGHWTELFPSVSPTARWCSEMVYDAADGYLLLFGGRLANANTSELYLNDTWSFNATGWHELLPTTAPSPRGRSAMMFDPAADEVVLFGGSTGTVYAPGTVFDDTWVYQGGAWSNITATAGTPPPPTVLASMSYDAADGYALLVGGISSPALDVFPCLYDRPGEWAFSGGKWSQLTPTGTVPPAGEGVTWYDPATGKTYYYEGVENLSTSGGVCDAPVGGVYAYAAGAWELVTPGGRLGSPPPRWFGSVVAGFDPNDGLFLIFGGQQTINGPFYADTWTYNASAIGAPGSTRFIVPYPSLGPTVTTDTFWLSPGNYTVESELSGYAPVLASVNVSGPLALSVDLAPNASAGIYTPLWAWSDAQLVSISMSGNGTPVNPYLLENDQTQPIPATFGLYNDYGYPVYPGLLLLDTNVSVDVRNPPSFLTSTGAPDGPSPALPSSNALPLWFWNVSGAALTGGVGLGGAETLVSELAPYDVIFFDSSDNLVAENNFTSPIAAMLLASGPTLGPFTGPGGANTVWGNRFLRSPYGYAEMGVVEVESHDLLYNNYFYSSDTACSPGDPSQPNICWPVYSFTTTSLVDAWNISVQSASTVHYAPGFPALPLSGSIIGTTWQGGNFWWNYGLYPNAYGVLPYDDGIYGIFTPYLPPLAFITGEGDYAPLIRVPLYTVTFTTTGLPEGGLWTGEVYSGTSSTVTWLYDIFHTTDVSYSIFLPNGSAWYSIEPPYGYRVTPGHVSFNVSGENLTIPLTIGLLSYTVQLVETGLPAKVLAKSGWTVVFNGTVVHGFGPTIAIPGVFYGACSVLVTGPAGYVSSQSGSVTVLENTTVNVAFAKGRTVTLTFGERGLAKGQSWCVSVDGASECTAKTSQKYVNLTAGLTYDYAVLSPLGGQNLTQKVGKVTTYGPLGAVTPTGSVKVSLTFAYRYAVTFTETGAPSGSWSVTIKGVTLSNGTGDPITFHLVNGTYGYRIGPISGYTSSGSPRRAVVPTAVSVAVTFTPRKGTSRSSALALTDVTASGGAT
jgi:hypothetical protein